MLGPHLGTSVASRKLSLMSPRPLGWKQALQSGTQTACPNPCSFVELVGWARVSIPSPSSSMECPVLDSPSWSPLASKHAHTCSQTYQPCQATWSQAWRGRSLDPRWPGSREHTMGLTGNRLPRKEGACSGGLVSGSLRLQRPPLSLGRRPFRLLSSAWSC